MVLFKEGDTEEEAISGLYNDLMEAKDKFTNIGQVLNDKKEHFFLCKARQVKGYGINIARITKEG
eukprot:423260-Heterocapsa_arctica.AAC.1